MASSFEVPKCRYCGTKVSYFGEICTDCVDDDVYGNDTMEIINADMRAMQDRMSAEDY